MSCTPRHALTGLPPAAGLRAHAAGLYPLEAAVDLLIEHAAWLHRDDFVDAFLHTHAATTDGPQMASIDFTGAVAALDAGDLPASSTEQRILKLAASIAEGTPVSLHHALTGLDHHNTTLVTTAVLHATGHRTSLANP